MVILSYDVLILPACRRPKQTAPHHLLDKRPSVQELLHVMMLLKIPARPKARTLQGPYKA